MNELQVILIICAVVFVGSLYWWGKKDKDQPLQRAYRAQDKDEMPDSDDVFEVVPVIKRETLKSKVDADVHVDHQSVKRPIISDVMELAALDEQESVQAEEVKSTLPKTKAVGSTQETQPDSLTERIQDLQDVPSVKKQQTTSHDTASIQSEQVVAEEPQVFALLVLSAAQKFKRKELHVAMEASRLSLHEDGTYVKKDANGRIVFRVANVVEPGYFPALDDTDFESPGVALVLQLPSSITPYRAMDEFITVARKVSQNLNAKLYDVQRQIIKESDLKTMREYAQSLTY